MNALIFALNLDFENQEDENNRSWEWWKHTARGSGPYVVAEIFRNHNIEAEVIDFIPFWYDEEIHKFLEQRKHLDYKFIGFSSTFPPIHTVKKYVQIAKQYFPNAVIIVGGQQDFYESADADYYINGFSELALPAVINHELSGSDLDYENLYNGKLVKTIHGKYRTHLLPDYQVYYHPDDFITQGDVLTIEIGRGCKFKCDFCNFSLIGLKDRSIRSSNDIRRELIRNYEMYGVTSYVIADDTPNETTERLQALADAVEGLDFTPKFSGFIRLDLVVAHPEQIDLLIKSNFTQHYYGIETFHKQAGKLIGKGMDSNKIKKCLLELRERIITECGEYHGDVGMIIGLPGEPKESIKQSYDWLLENWNGKGQNVIWWPLQISENGLIDSKFSENPERYGFTRIDIEDEERFELAMMSKPNLKSFPWKHDNMDVMEAMDMFEEFTEPWWDSKRAFGYGESATATARFGNVNEPWDNPNYKTEFMEITYKLLKDYKTNKLKKYEN